jgi:hypothetical protein
MFFRSLVLDGLPGSRGVGHHLRKQPRVHINANKSSRFSDDWAKDFPAACPHMAFADDENAADYTIEAVWAPTQRRWMAWIERSDGARIYPTENADSVQLLRESCRDIRDDVEDWAAFDTQKPPNTKASAPVGRYALSYHPSNYNRAILLDTKSGAVWELQYRSYNVGGKKFDYPQFNRVAVDGLYTSMEEQMAQYADIDMSQDSEDKKKARRDQNYKISEKEREREAAFDEQ